MKIHQLISQNLSRLSFNGRSNPNGVKVSVILPIYNQEKYLTTALDSLQNQTLKDAEFICVNDGSKDNSLKILQDYAQRDCRIKILDQINQSAGVARNNGLKVAKGEYVAFLDPDDWLEPNALETLYKKSKKQDCDMLVFNFKRLDEAGNVLSVFNLKNKMKRFHDIRVDENFHWRDIKPRVLGGMYPVAWNKFYKRDLIKNNGLHFAKCNMAEDNVFVFGATLNAKKIGYEESCLYNYIVHNSSALRSKSNKNLSIFKSIDCVKKLLDKMGLAEELKNEYDGYIFRFVSYHSKQILSMSKLKELCKKKLTAYQSEVLLDRFEANAKLLPIVQSLLTKKMKL